jgi:hypothetical protein
MLTADSITLTTLVPATLQAMAFSAAGHDAMIIEMLSNSVSGSAAWASQLLWSPIPSLTLVFPQSMQRIILASG